MKAKVVLQLAGWPIRLAAGPAGLIAEALCTHDDWMISGGWRSAGPAVLTIISILL